MIFVIAGLGLIGAVVVVALVAVVGMAALFVVGFQQAIQLWQKSEQDGEL